MEALGNPHSHIIQDLGSQNARLIEQLQKRSVDAGQYYGEWLTANRWRAWAGLHPQSSVSSIPLDEEAPENVVVVDFGPGTAGPSIAAIREFHDRVQQVTCVDTSNEIGLMAAENYQSQLHIPAKVLVADFIRDSGEILSVINMDARSKVCLCLGNTVANYDQTTSFSRLRSMLGDNDDRFIFGLGIHDGTNADERIRKLGEILCSPENLRFGLEFLRQYGVDTDPKHVSYEVLDDPDERDVKVVHVLYEFPEGKYVKVDEQLHPSGVRFKKGEKILIVESRRYPKKGMEAFFKRHNLDLLDQRDFGSHGLFLTKRQESGILGKINARSAESPSP